jgi:hypothetical protein
MSQSLKGLGSPVNFGFKATSGDTGVTATPFTGFLLQRSGLKTSGELERVRSLQGDVTSENYYGQESEFDLTFVISKSTGIADSIAATTLTGFTAGTILAITASASMPDAVYATWIVQYGAEITQETTKSAEYRIPLKKVPNVTAAQTS